MLTGNVQTALENLERYSPIITAAISEYYNYLYDDGRTGYDIIDGGRDMFDGGNKVSRIMISVYENIFKFQHVFSYYHRSA